MNRSGAGKAHGCRARRPVSSIQPGDPGEPFLLGGPQFAQLEMRIVVIPPYEFSNFPRSGEDRKALRARELREQSLGQESPLPRSGSALQPGWGRREGEPGSSEDKRVPGPHGLSYRSGLGNVYPVTLVFQIKKLRFKRERSHLAACPPPLPPAGAPRVPESGGSSESKKPRSSSREVAQLRICSDATDPKAQI